MHCIVVMLVLQLQKITWQWYCFVDTWDKSNKMWLKWRLKLSCKSTMMCVCVCVYCMCVSVPHQKIISTLKQFCVILWCIFIGHWFWNCWQMVLSSELIAVISFECVCICIGIVFRLKMNCHCFASANEFLWNIANMGNVWSGAHAARQTGAVRVLSCRVLFLCSSHRIDKIQQVFSKWLKGGCRWFFMLLLSKRKRFVCTHVRSSVFVCMLQRAPQNLSSITYKQ